MISLEYKRLLELRLNHLYKKVQGIKNMEDYYISIDKNSFDVSIKEFQNLLHSEDWDEDFDARRINLEDKENYIISSDIFRDYIGLSFPDKKLNNHELNLEVKKRITKMVRFFDDFLQKRNLAISIYKSSKKKTEPLLSSSYYNSCILSINLETKKMWLKRFVSIHDKEYKDAQYKLDYGEYILESYYFLLQDFIDDNILKYNIVMSKFVLLQHAVSIVEEHYFLNLWLPYHHDILNL